MYALFPHFRINFFWLNLSWLVSIFYDENNQNKHKEKKTKTNKVNYTKTFENIKHEPILKQMVLWCHLFRLWLEKWVKCLNHGQNIIL